MVDAPEKLWMTAEELGWPGSFRSFRMSDLEHPEDEYPAYVRADLYEQVKRERDGANQRAEIMTGAAKRFEARAERLAGARVKAGPLAHVIAEMLERAGEPRPNGDILHDILAQAVPAALAEPAGEAEPSKWTVPGSSYAGATTPTDASAIRDALDGADEVEVVARLLWERFSSSHVQTWEEETHRSEYRFAAADCLSIIMSGKDARHEAVAFLYKHGDLTHSAAHLAIELLAGNGFTISRIALAGAKP